ncbi:peptidoglycan DD-metalloendopeptidase family protein [Dongshaea marina]|uniref:peptidoglycan DD-metalloendopeptidase family protein n=1 Tax=Dongshaea marina TaxID=2047966 RepID=UPI000D3EBB73|nr:peptidoglycan DD-metalloendopeptidase family protein [Dongshaea marina]
MNPSASFIQQLSSLSCAPIIPAELQFGPALILDLSPQSPMWQQLADPAQFETYVAQQMQQQQTQLCIGRYNEQRLIYQDKPQFSDSSDRTLHIGLDLGVPAGTAVMSPLDAEVHGFARHQQDGDYGPVIILKHKLPDLCFYTLYGHLSSCSLENISRGKQIRAGERFAAIGDRHENGGWAPHLHLQIIRDLEDYQGDYPGVVAPKEADFYLANCPDPNLLVRRQDL